MTARVLLTGATGFVGRHLCRTLAESGYRVRVAARNSHALAEGAEDGVVVGDICATTNWSAALKEVEYVVHAAAHVHDARASGSSAHLMEETNVHGTQRLAAESARMHVKRFVLLSSVKVNGETSLGDGCNAFDTPHPQDDYARSKLRAELLVAGTCAVSELSYVVIRSPLVYGAGVGANFLRLMRWIDRGYPLPFGAVRNKRSFVSVWNLADLILHTLSHAAASNHTWMVSDGEDLSTAELIRRIATAMGRPLHLLSIPESALRFAGVVSGRRAEISRLCDSLCVNLAQTVALLRWNPPMTVDAGLARTVDWYQSNW